MSVYGKDCRFWICLCFASGSGFVGVDGANGSQAVRFLE